MGTSYRKSFTPYLELFEPRSAYISELRLQHIWKHSLWKISRMDTDGRGVKVLSPGRHNHSDGPDFLEASIILDGKLKKGDIEIHHRTQDWYSHGHHCDKSYNRCILHVVFHDPKGCAGVKCSNGIIPATCYISLEEALDCEMPSSCRIFKPDSEKYYKTLAKAGCERIRKKIKYFYENRLRFPNDVMLYWGLFKACGYRYNEENMLKLFVKFPWAAYCDGLIDPKDILPMLNTLAGFKDGSDGNIRWTRSRTRPAHFPENRVDWLGKIMTYHYRASLSGMIYDMIKNGKNIFDQTEKLFCMPLSHSPGKSLRKEMIMNTLLPLMEAIRMDRREDQTLKNKIMHYFETVQVSTPYATVKRFHDEHGIKPKDKLRNSWLISQGVLNIRDTYCSQNDQLRCPICLLEK